MKLTTMKWVTEYPNIQSELYLLMVYLFHIPFEYFYCFNQINCVLFNYLFYQ